MWDNKNHVKVGLQILTKLKITQVIQENVSFGYKNERHVPFSFMGLEAVFRCQMKTKAMLLTLELNKSHIVDVGSKQKPCRVAET